jgi:hypothetical protein
LNKLSVYPIILFILLISGCARTSLLLDQEPEISATEPDYSLIIYIHGDSDYLFHDSDGNRIRADQHALQKAMNVAENAASGEVFIFHHQPAKRFLWMIPRRTNHLYQYKNGEKVRHISYRRSSEKKFMEKESGFFREYRTAGSEHEHPAYFAYFGHEIPASHYAGYNRSHPEVVVDTESFAGGTRSFLEGDGQAYDLMILSSCSNGTPGMVKELDGITRMLLASPQNLHLSHMDISALNLLETEEGISAAEIASAIAEDTYERLSESIQTVISLSVYDIAEVREYIGQLHDATTRYEEEVNPNPYRENIDCAALPFFDAAEFSGGVDTLYRPPRFGRRSTGNTSSGWGCKGE